MGIEASYRRLRPEELKSLLEFPEIADGFLYGEWPHEENLEVEGWFKHVDHLKETGRYLDIDQDWHAIHFLLTGDTAMDWRSPVPPPLRNVVVGGTETPFEATYGKIRYLTPHEVKEVAQVLNQISMEDLRRRFDPQAFNQARIYPNPRPGGWKESHLESVLGVYQKIVQFFQQAAWEGDVLLLSQD